MDLIIVSFKMPFMDGPKFLSFIRRDENLCKIPVIFMVAANERNLVGGTGSALARGYIRKPDFDKAGLMLIKNVLNEGKYWRK